MIKKIFASAFIIFYILCLPLQSYSLNAQQRNYNKVMKVNASGAAKVAARMPVIARGLWAAGAFKAFPYIGTAVMVGILVYNGIQFYRGWTMGNVPPVVAPLPILPSGDPLLPTAGVGNYSYWGQQQGTDFIMSQRRSWSGALPTCVDGAVVNRSEWVIAYTGWIPDNHYANGGYTEINTVVSCGSTSYKIHEYTYLYTMPFHASPALPPDIPWVDDRDLSSPIPDANRNQIASDLAAARAGMEAAIIANPANTQTIRPLITLIEAAQDAMKPIELTSDDYTIAPGEVPIENTYEPGTDPAVFPEDVPIEEPIPDVPPIIPNDACIEYQRKKHFDYSSLLQSAQAVPLLGLLSKLVINPASQQFNGKVTFQLSKFGTQEIDLNKWHYSDAIAIFRFVIIGGAFLTAIRIIYD